MKDNIKAFSEIEKFLINYIPLTPYGRSDKNKYQIFEDEKELNHFYDLIESMQKFIDYNPEESYKIEYHLKRIPKLEKTLSMQNAISEIFNVKKFLVNYKMICKMISKEISEDFELQFASEKLLGYLDIGDNQDETFYLSDSYSKDLRKIRKDINELNGELDQIRIESIELIREKLSIDFRFHDFLVINERDLPEDTHSLIFIEPYDKDSVLMKPIHNKEYLAFHSKRQVFLETEKEIEISIKLKLISEIEKEREQISSYIESIRVLDIILAKARLSLRFPSVRPIINQDENISIHHMNYIPLKEKCGLDKREYTPLTADFDAGNIVITGSNMGGKTVILKSILFSQLLVQMGFFVPADRIETNVFHSFNLIGMDNEEFTSGLSSFGSEVMNLIESDLKFPSLFIVDEFARTTNSVEAKALNCALMQWFSQESGIYSFSSTHQEDLPDFSNLSYWNMKGLDYVKYNTYYHKDYKSDLDERIGIINEFMDYGLEPSGKSNNKRDAIKIADILGIDSRIIEYAKNYIKKQENNNGK